MALLAGCVAPGPTVRADGPPCVEARPAVDATAEVRGAVKAFVEAAEARDFAAAWRLLAGPWRDRYTPERLAEDFEREPRGPGLVSRLKASLGAPVVVDGPKATLLVGGARVARLVLEPSGWRLESLDAPAR